MSGLEPIGDTLHSGVENKLPSPDLVQSAYPQSPTDLPAIRLAQDVYPKAPTDMAIVDSGKIIAGGYGDSKPLPLPLLGGGHRSRHIDGGDSSEGGGNWFFKEARELSSAAASSLCDIGGTIAQTGRDIVHGRATLGEVGFALEEAGVVIGAGATVALLAGVEAPVAGVVAVGGMAVAAGGALMMMYDPSMLKSL